MLKQSKEKLEQSSPLVNSESLEVVIKFPAFLVQPIYSPASFTRVQSSFLANHMCT